MTMKRWRRDDGGGGAGDDDDDEEEALGSSRAAAAALGSQALECEVRASLSKSTNHTRTVPCQESIRQQKNCSVLILLALVMQALGQCLCFKFLEVHPKKGACVCVCFGIVFQRDCKPFFPKLPSRAAQFKTCVSIPPLVC